jgi:hypothetical protein
MRQLAITTILTIAGAGHAFAFGAMASTRVLPNMAMFGDRALTTGQFEYSPEPGKSFSVGFSFNSATPDEAKAEALYRCQASLPQGETCEIQFTYHHQCVGHAHGDNNVSVLQLGDSIEEGRMKALTKCTEAGGGKVCQVTVRCDDNDADHWEKR